MISTQNLSPIESVEKRSKFMKSVGYLDFDEFFVEVGVIQIGYFSKEMECDMIYQLFLNNINNNNGPNGHLFYVGGDLMMRRGMLPIIMLPDGDLRIVLHLVPFWILTIWGSVHIEETVVGWRNQLRMKTPVT